ncbi:MAG: hypothetical protein FWF05_01270 [Oscillospiraceae bacterium]|nr:hypothetical protein [Oscillospiraceae bacterium]
MTGKKGTAAVAMLFAVIFLLAACEKNSKYGVYLVDDKGMTHVLATDKNGSTMRDEHGNLIEVATDSANQKPITTPNDIYITGEDGQVLRSMKAGDYQTYTITFPDLIAQKDLVEAVDYSLPIPKGWESVGISRPHIINPKTEAFVQGMGSDMYGSVEEALVKYEEIREKMKQERDTELPYTLEDIKIPGKTGQVWTYDLGDIYTITYFLEHDGKVFPFRCVVNKEYAAQTDFNSIISEVKFK